ncbi:hypothetical protein RMSM_07048 [Rhodopirellula maiorica SM1]|uniref:Uncharacterized protein n=1 Tax=Rhodopirellula maiorica SM1 TaxID=1265738 RepID=M5RPY2_9BACT|nr:hypothetical protein RMSM_07048 [Rhodopirellula maiorica SM1]
MKRKAGRSPTRRGSQKRVAQERFCNKFVVRVLLPIVWKEVFLP